MEIRFNTVLKIPHATAQQRRFTAGGNHPTSGMKKAAATWQALFEHFAPDMPFARGVPLKVEIVLCFNGKKLLAPMVTRPDIDNLAKMILDAMTRARFWEDDNQVATLHITKCIYSSQGDNDIISVKVSEITEMELTHLRVP